MKKEYISPEIQVICLENTENILQSSPGTTEDMIKFATDEEEDMWIKDGGYNW